MRRFPLFSSLTLRVTEVKSVPLGLRRPAQKCLTLSRANYSSLLKTVGRTLSSVLNQAEITDEGVRATVFQHQIEWSCRRFAPF